MNHLAKLSKALRDRLSDTQINLKPIAARVIGGMLSSVDKATQAKIGKIVFGPLITAAMNDIKKPMRDASLEALKAGTTVASLDGGGINAEALEEFVVALVNEVNERSSRVSITYYIEFCHDIKELDPFSDLRFIIYIIRLEGCQMCFFSFTAFLDPSLTLLIFSEKSMLQSLLNASRLRSLRRGLLQRCY